MKYDTILLDADGTLLDFDACERTAICSALRACGVEPTPRLATRYSEINLSLWKQLERKELPREVLKTRRFEQLVEEEALPVDPLELSDRYLTFLADGPSYVLEGAETLLKRLRPHARLYLATNGTKHIQSARLAKSGLLPFVDGVFMSEDVGYVKPDVRFFEEVARRVPSLSPERTLMVGDSLSSDIKGGIAYGMDTCWYNPLCLPVPAELRPTYVASNFDEIYRFALSEKG